MLHSLKRMRLRMRLLFLEGLSAALWHKYFEGHQQCFQMFLYEWHAGWL